MADPAPAADATSEKTQDPITTIATPETFDNLLSSHNYVAIDFHATWCGPCRIIAPIFAQLAAAHAVAGSIAFARVDVDEVPELAHRYGVTTLPTFAFIRYGEKFSELKSVRPPQLRSEVEAMVKDFKENEMIKKALEDQDW
ncbi:thioredoxin-like protein [Colletotrichum musicola]|uniref:Thioredoxin-like protein n=1 Tax=Colletotrichum musicola TaxID=2175873 RepID=A0A8H6KN79_9PEZI|nr:thioredoxin-like protein [Colletotrichum musicola]